MVLDILIEIPRMITLVILGFAVALLTTLAQKFFTNQKVLKAIKDEMKELREQIKNTNDKEHAGKLNKVVMDKSFSQMKHSMRSMFITFIPLIFLFGWLNANLTYYGIEGGEFSTTVFFEEGATGTVEIDPGDLELIEDPVQDVKEENTWNLRGDPGVYSVEYIYNSNVYALDVELGNRNRYLDAELAKGGFISFGESLPSESKIESIQINLQRVHPLGGFTIFGWQPGILTLYIVFSIIFSTLLRKYMKVH